MLKAPPLNPRDYKSRTSKISLEEGHLNVRKNVRKSSKNRKRLTMGYPNKKGRQGHYSPDKCNIIKIGSNS